MAIIPISQLTATPGISLTDLFVLDHAGTTYKGTIGQILSLGTLAGDADVTLSNVTTGQVLTYTVIASGGGYWSNKNPIATFATLTDVDATTKASGKYLTYNPSNSKFDFEAPGFPFSIIQESMNSSGGVTSISTTLVAATTVGNTLLGVVGYAKNNGTYSIPGWTQIFQVAETGPYSGLSLYIKPASGETSVQATGGTGGDSATILIYEIQGNRTVDTFATSNNNVGITQNNFPKITPTTGSMVFAFGTVTCNGSGVTMISSNFTRIDSPIYNAARTIYGGILKGPAPSSNFMPPQALVPNYNGSTGPVLATISIL